ncbi:MAG TPA: hypothetical protein VJV74_04725 [Terriglobia bacterium]|nr:hypothetical protein [Terriglobia bacterium]
MTFEEAGRAVDREVQKLVEFVDQKVRPSTRREMAELLKKASESLAKMAAGLQDRPDSGQQPENKP